ncbi:MAG: response regulator transcription factor [Gemmatimonadota bacterium]
MKPLRVIIVDDHGVVLQGLRAVLDQADDIQVVAEGRDGNEAVSLACEHRPDVAILDVSMPEIDGIEATKLILKRCPEVSILALTRHDDRAHLNRMLEAGATGYVLKQSPAADLVRAIRNVAAGQTYVDPILAGPVLSRSARTRGTSPAGDALSSREEEVLRLIAWGHSNKSIGKRLEISPRTVETYRSRIASKLGVQTRSEIVRYAVTQGWLTSDSSSLPG